MRTLGTYIRKEFQVVLLIIILVFGALVISIIPHLYSRHIWRNAATVGSTMTEVKSRLGVPDFSADKQLLKHRNPKSFLLEHAPHHSVAIDFDVLEIYTRFNIALNSMYGVYYKNGRVVYAKGWGS